MTLLRRLKQFLANRGGNVAVLAALMMPPVILAMGAGLDYIQAAGREERLNGIADAAALAAVTPSAMQDAGTTTSAAAASASACALFKSQAAMVGNIDSSGFNCSSAAGGTDPTVNNATNPSITVTDDTSGTSAIRTVNVTYTSASHNVFVGVLGFPKIAISGAAASKSGLAPQINFYLLIDTSPSMEIPAKAAGIAQMVQLTGSTACAFACHETNPTAGDVGSNPNGEDNYTLSRNNCIALRIDLVNDAVNNLMQVAPATATANNTYYGMALYTIDSAFNSLVPLSGCDPKVTSACATNTWSALTGNPSGYTKDGGCTTTSIPNYLTISPETIYSNNIAVKGTNDQDEDTNLPTALTNMYNLMPTPGSGLGGNPAKEVLFIVSDAMPDFAGPNGRTYGPLDDTTCTAIKAQGIRIAFLYLTYNPITPLPTNKPNKPPAAVIPGAWPGATPATWYNNHIYALQFPLGYSNPAGDGSIYTGADFANDTIAPAAQACASPGLYFQVNTDGDITSALAALFQKAVATAYLSK